MAVSAVLSHASYTLRSFKAADWSDLAEECRRRAESHTCVDCGQDLSPAAALALPDEDPSEAWEMLMIDGHSRARCRYCGFHAHPWADATIEEHMAACPQTPPKKQHRLRGDRWSCAVRRPAGTSPLRIYMSSPVPNLSSSLPAWLALVLDRVLPDLTGGQRDAIATAITEAVPRSVLELAIGAVLQKHAVLGRGLDRWGPAIAAEAAEAVFTALREAP